MSKPFLTLSPVSLTYVVSPTTAFSRNPLPSSRFHTFPVAFDVSNAFFTRNQAVPFPVCPSPPSVRASSVARPRGYAVAPSPRLLASPQTQSHLRTGKYGGHQGSARSATTPVRRTLRPLPPCLLGPLVTGFVFRVVRFSPCVFAFKAGHGSALTSTKRAAVT